MSLSANPQAIAEPAQVGEAAYRYGVVFLIVLLAVVFAIVAPDGAGTRAIAFAILGAAMLVAVGTSRERTDVRRTRALVGGAAIAIITIGTAAGPIPRAVTLAATALLTLAIPITLAGGLLRLVRRRGATTQAVAGGLAIYLLVGLGFASAIGFVAAVESGRYFAQAGGTTASEHVYYSFTVLTTTGFGDLTAAHGAGRALAVLEMLVGQLYLVTVIGVLVGRRVEKAR
jgi:Ion channel